MYTYESIDPEFFEVGGEIMLLDRNLIKETCMNEIRDEWLTAPSSFPDFLPEIERDRKTQNEQYIQSVFDLFQKQLKCFPRNARRRGSWKRKTLGLLKLVMQEETILDTHRAMDQQAMDAFLDEIGNFLVHVREFAPELSFEGIGQAIRNYIVYAMFNEMNQLRTAFSLSGFGYSMLYPFTDNYIDSPLHTDKEKGEYNRLIRDKIEGKEVHPSTPHQLKTCQLLDAIESEYPRQSDPVIFSLLLMMLEAQENSLRQQGDTHLLTPEERLDISIYKGGISVLIDRYFVKREITKDDLTFYFGFGFFLQLADDLQDIKDDNEEGNQTVFTVDLRCVVQEEIVNKMLHFVHHLMLSGHAENELFKNFILTNCCQLIFSAIVGNREFFSTGYLNKIENYFPVSFPFREKMSRRPKTGMDIKTQDRYMKILDELIQQEK